MASAREPIAVIGTGYAGLVTAAGFAELGSEVWCVDVDADKVARLQRGEVPIWEPGLEQSIARNRERLHFSTEIGPALDDEHPEDISFAVDALRHLVQSGARPRAAASVVAALTGTRANDLYRALTGRDPRL